MVDIDMPNVSSPLMEQLEALGPIFGVVLILAGAFLMIRGHERLQYIAAAVGAGVGYVGAPLVYALIPDGTIDELYIMIILMLITAGILLITVQLTIHLAASLGIYLGFSWGFQWLDARGYEFASSEFVTNAMAVIAFFSVIYIRKKLPLLVSALLGSLATLSGMLVLNGQPLSTLDPGNSSTIVIVLMLSILSVTVQMRAIKRKSEAELPPEERGLSRKDRRKKMAEEDPRIYRAPSEHDLPDLR